MPEKFHQWLSVAFLLLTWYVPRQTAPGGYLEDFLVLRWITFILIPIIVLAFLLYRLKANPKIYLGNIIWPVLLLFVVVLLSGAVNKSTSVATAFTLLIYLRYPLLFLVLINWDLNEKSLDIFLKLFFILVIIQIPETFYRYFISGIRWDHISWTLGPWGHFDLGVYMMYATALIVARSLVFRIRKAYVIVIGCFFLVALFGEIKAYIFFAPLTICFVVWNCLAFTIPRRRFYAIISLAVVAALSFSATIALYERVFPESRDLYHIRTALDPGQEGRIHRVAAFTDLLRKLGRDPAPALLGWGPGSSLAGELGVEADTGFDIPIRHKNQLAETFIDLGFAGLIAYFWLLFCLFGQYRRHYKLEKEKKYLYLNRALTGIWIFFAFLGPLYDLVWRHDSPNYVFFFLTAVIYCRYRKLRDESSAD